MKYAMKIASFHEPSQCILKPEGLIAVNYNAKNIAAWWATKILTLIIFEILKVH